MRPIQSMRLPSAFTESRSHRSLNFRASVRFGFTATFNGLLCPPVFSMRGILRTA